MDIFYFSVDISFTDMMYLAIVRSSRIIAVSDDPFLRSQKLKHGAPASGHVVIEENNHARVPHQTQT
jgi:hypothetical protein